MSKKAMEDGSFIAMNKCYYCGKEKDILLSQRFRDISHLHNKVSDMEPCTKCKEFMQKGVIVVSVRDGEPQTGNPPDPYRTGGWWVMTIESVQRVFNKDFTNEKLRFMFIEDSVADQVGLIKGG